MKQLKLLKKIICSNKVSKLCEFLLHALTYPLIVLLSIELWGVIIIKCDYSFIAIGITFCLAIFSIPINLFICKKILKNKLIIITYIAILYIVYFNLGEASKRLDMKCRPQIFQNEKIETSSL